ncbi:hypothetical protein TKK_0019058 [Trichogramma kaykai]
MFCHNPSGHKASTSTDATTASTLLRLMFYFSHEPYYARLTAVCVPAYGFRRDLTTSESSLLGCGVRPQADLALPQPWKLRATLDLFSLVGVTVPAASTFHDREGLLADCCVVVSINNVFVQVRFAGTLLRRSDPGGDVAGRLFLVEDGVEAATMASCEEGASLHSIVLLSAAKARVRQEENHCYRAAGSLVSSCPSRNQQGRG